MNKKISVDVQKWEPLKNGKVRVKIAQTRANLLDLQHHGRDYIVLRNMGRGRYMVRLRANLKEEDHG